MFKINLDKNIFYHSFYKGKIWASKNRDVICSNDYGKSWRKILTVSELPFLSRSKLYNRLTRNGISNIINIRDDLFAVIIKKRILLYQNESLLKSFKIERGSRPIRQCILNYDGNLIYGDYWNNENREPANINIINTRTMERTFLKTIYNVRHIHFIQQSKYDSNQFYIGTGDEDNECIILTLNIKSNELIRLGGGSQDWRAVSVLQKDNYLYWGTDAPNDQNYIFQYDLEKKRISKVQPVAGPVFYSAESSKGVMMLASIVEYRGVHKSIIYISKDGTEWTELMEFEKDIFPLYLFGFGVVDFIQGQEKLEEIYINTHGLK
ncbi:hypothetical protein [Halobacillus mangrovi]|uniref:hypothetical protein n=1 Tax=Halobacillus mangrovi TaxID=402384 RepID=UPI003D99AFD1